MGRPAAWLPAACLAGCLAACSLAPTQPAPPARFDLGPVNTGNAGAALVVGEIAAPP